MEFSFLYDQPDTLNRTKFIFSPSGRKRKNKTVRVRDERFEIIAKGILHQKIQS